MAVGGPAPFELSHHERASPGARHHPDGGRLPLLPGCLIGPNSSPAATSRRSHRCSSDEFVDAEHLRVAEVDRPRFLPGSADRHERHTGRSRRRQIVTVVADVQHLPR